MVLALRIVAGSLAAVWAMLLFGITDLATALTWRAGWEPTLVLEASWGALFTFFMILPLVIVVGRPARFAEAGFWSVVVALSLLVGGIAVGDPMPVWLAAAALLTGAIVVGLGLATRRAELPRPKRPHVQPSWLLAALAVAALPLWGTYVAHAGGGHPGVPPSVTIAFDHWPVQAAAGVAVIFAAVVAALVVDLRAVAVWAAALSAAVIGVTMALSQELPVATESPTWCIAAVLWGTGMALALHAAPYTGLAPAEGIQAARPTDVAPSTDAAPPMRQD